MKSEIILSQGDNAMNDVKISVIPERDTIIDALRGLGIILVVMAHVSAGFAYSNLSSGSIAFIGDYIDGFHMPLFFIISGYAHGMKERFSSGESVWPYIKKSAIDLYIPGIYFSLLYWLPKYILVSIPAFATENFRTVSLNDFLRIPLYGFNLYWFLLTMFFVKVLHMIFERYVKRESVHLLFWLLMYSVAIIFFMRDELNSKLRDIAEFLVRDEEYFFSVFYTGIYFHIGFMMKRRSFIPQRLSRGIILLLAGTGFFVASHFYEFRNIFTRTGSSVCLSLALFIIFYALNINYRFLVLCGLNSMVIYCLHNHIVAMCRVIFRLTGLSSTASTIILFAICAFCAVLIPLIIVWLYKNVKSLHWIEYIFYPGRYRRYKRENSPLR